MSVRDEFYFNKLTELRKGLKEKVQALQAQTARLKIATEEHVAWVKTLPPNHRHNCRQAGLAI